MKAIILTDFGPVDHLIEAELQVPEPKANEVQIEVHAVAINPVDVKTRSGKAMAGRLKEENPVILGWDISGVVTKAGPEATLFKPGDPVFGMINFPGHGKGYAEYVVAPETHLALKPANIAHSEAAAAGIAALTAYQAVAEVARVSRGQKVFIQAGAGGVGHYAVQLAKHYGAEVIASSSQENREFLSQLGVDKHIDYTKENFETMLHDIDFVLDALGGENIDRSLKVVKRGGTLVSIPSGISESVSEKAKEKGVQGVFFLVQSDQQRIKKVAELLAEGIIKSHVSQTFPLKEIQKAHQQVASGKTRGKIVIKIKE